MKDKQGMDNILNNAVNKTGAYDKNETSEGTYKVGKRESSATNEGEMTPSAFNNNKSGTAGYNVRHKQKASVVNSPKPAF